MGARRVQSAATPRHDNVHVVPTARLGDLIGTLASARHPVVKRALGHALDWPELKAL
jgi:hypothetical protein